MIRLGRQRGMWTAAACLAALALAGCGASGDAGADIPANTPPTTAAVQGIIKAPNGQFASAKWWRLWARQLQLIPAAYALLQDDLLPIESVENVSLARIDAVDAAHGSTERSTLLAEVRTEENGGGAFKVVHSSIGHLEDDCRLMLSVGTPDAVDPQHNLLTRAFVLQRDHNNIDAVSEAVVRVVLDKLAGSSAGLCDFSVKELLDISNKVFEAAATASGSTVGEVNQSAYELASANRLVQLAIENAAASN